ncbi:hypothetical protein LC55x_2645 [Lysobacter capsici]|nr:hypothetical protein LC55x_2645 [Lysobacter capsici]
MRAEAPSCSKPAWTGLYVVALWWLRRGFGTHAIAQPIARSRCRLASRCEGRS